MNDLDLFKALEAGDHNRVEQLISSTFLNKTGKLYLTDPYGFPAFFKALELKDYKIADLFISKGYDVNRLVNKAVTPLMWAVKNYKTDVVDYLLNKGADVNIQNQSTINPLFLAVWRGEKDIVELILSKVATITERIPGLLLDGKVLPLMFKCTEISEMLIAHVADTKYLSYLLCLAVVQSNIQIVQLLLNKGADINTNIAKSSPLLIALKHKFEEMALFLVKNGADLNVVDKEGNTPLLLALKYSLLTAADAMLNSNADIEARNKNGDSALVVAAASGNKQLLDEIFNSHSADDIYPKLMNPVNPLFEELFLKIIGSLHERGVAIDEKNSNDSTALLYSIFGNATKITEYLLDNGASFNVINKCGYTPLMGAVLRGNKDLAERMISEKVDFYPIMRFDCLHCAIASGSKEMVNLLISNDFPIREAGLNFVKYDYMIAAVYAVTKTGSLEIAETLLANNISVNNPKTYQYSKYSPLGYSCILGNKDMAWFLLSNGANIGQRKFLDKVAETDLNWAIWGGNLDIVKMLIENGADITFEDCLTWVRDNGVEISDYLIRKGGIVNTSIVYGDTPLMHAAKANNIELVELLLSNGAIEKEKRTTQQYDYITRLFEGNAIETIIHLLPREYMKDQRNRVFNLAVENGFAGLVQHLLEENPNQVIPDWGLLTAVKNGHKEMSDLLYKKGLRINLVDSYGDKMLYSYHNEELKEVLILYTN